MRKAIISFLLCGILGISLASGGISIDTWEFWVVWVCLLGMGLNLVHD
jgi:hypothetical protein